MEGRIVEGSAAVCADEGESLGKSYVALTLQRLRLDRLCWRDAIERWHVCASSIAGEMVLNARLTI